MMPTIVDQHLGMKGRRSLVGWWLVGGWAIGKILAACNPVVGAL